MNDNRKPTFRVAHRLCINCGRDVVFSIPYPQPQTCTDDVLDEAMKEHTCGDLVLPPIAKPAWRKKP